MGGRPLWLSATTGKGESERMQPSFKLASMDLDACVQQRTLVRAVFSCLGRDGNTPSLLLSQMASTF